MTKFLPREPRLHLVVRMRKGRPGLVLMPSKKNPKVKRWVRASPEGGGEGATGGHAAPAGGGGSAREGSTHAPTSGWVDSLPHLPTDTLEHHTKDGKLTPERQALHEKILAKYLDPVSPVPEGEKPEAVVMMGGTASGKTTATKHLNLDKSKFVNLNADDVKDDIPEYEEAVKGRARNAAALAHEESSMLMKQIRDKALDQRKNVIMDGTGANKKAYLELIQRMKARGYHVTVIMPDLDAETAKKRSDERAEKSGRYVPHEFIEHAYAKIPHNFQEIANAGDDFHLYDSRRYPPPPVWSKVDGKETIHDPEFVKQFREKYGGEASMRKGSKGATPGADKPRNIGGAKIKEIVERGFRAAHDEHERLPRRFTPDDGFDYIEDDAAIER